MREKLKEKLMNNFSLKILSVLAAILLWLVVVNVDDPIKTETYAGIRVSMLNETAITSKGKVYKIEDETDVISVVVSAKRSVHKNLTSADFIATADMEKDIQYDNLVAINVACTNKNVKASDIKKSWNNVKVSIEDSATEEFNVVVKQKGTPGSGYVVGEMIPEQRVISVSGPASLIAKIKRIEAEVDVTGRTADDTVVCSLNIVNSDGDALDTTYLQYNGKTTGMSVKVNMLKTKTVPLKFSVTGTPAEGCRYVGLSFKPEAVEIAGSSADLQNVFYIEVPGEAVNIEGFAETQAVEVNLKQYLKENIRLVDEAADGVAVVTVEIEEQQTRDVKIPISNVSLTGVPKGYSVTFGDLEDVTISVTGLESELDELDTDAIAVTLDVSSFTKAGTYTKELDIHVPGECSASGQVEIEFELIRGTSGQGNTEKPKEDEDNTSGENPTGGASGGNTSGGNTTSGGTGSGDSSGGSSTGDSANSGNTNSGGSGNGSNGNQSSNTGGNTGSTEGEGSGSGQGAGNINSGANQGGEGSGNETTRLN